MYLKRLLEHLLRNRNLQPARLTHYLTNMTLLEIYESQCRLEEANDELYEMARVSSRQHGIPGVVIWVGEVNKRHGLRVKVSNLRDKWSNDDNFVIMMPSLDYDPKKVAKWIDMQAVLAWIKLNQEVLYQYELGEISLTDEFMSKLSSL